MKPGEKIKIFRNSRNLSQTELELLIGAANGSISRIESGTTNPTKETILSIAQELKLSEKEVNFIFGKNDLPVTDEEILIARNMVKDLFETRGVLAYLIDDRYRLVGLSDSFFKIIDKPRQILNNSILELALDPKHKIFQYLDKENLDKTLRPFIENFYMDTYFMQDDEIIQQSIRAINNNEITQEIYQKVQSKGYIKEFHTNEERKAYFNFYGIKFGVMYSATNLYQIDRIKLCECYQDGIIFKALRQLL